MQMNTIHQTKMADFTLTLMTWPNPKTSPWWRDLALINISNLPRNGSLATLINISKMAAQEGSIKPY